MKLYFNQNHNWFISRKEIFHICVLFIHVICAHADAEIFQPFPNQQKIFKIKEKQNWKSSVQNRETNVDLESRKCL